jgi:HSP20 family molecular chaperone IbpA
VRHRSFAIRYDMVLVTSSSRPMALLHTERFLLAEPRWRPAVDLYETPGAVRVTVDLAGVEEDDVEILLFDDAVVIEGTRVLPACEGEAVYHAAAIRQGPFRAAVALPAPVDTGAVEARFERGLLRVALPKLERG